MSMHRPILATAVAATVDMAAVMVAATAVDTAAVMEVVMAATVDMAVVTIITEDTDTITTTITDDKHINHTKDEHTPFNMDIL